MAQTVKDGPGQPIPGRAWRSSTWRTDDWNTHQQHLLPVAHSPSLGPGHPAPGVRRLLREEALWTTFLAKPFHNAALVDKFQSLHGRHRGGDRGVQNTITRMIPGKDQPKNFDFSDKYKTVNIYSFTRDYLQDCFLPTLELYIRMRGQQEYYELVMGVLLFMGNQQLCGPHLRPPPLVRDRRLHGPAARRGPRLRPSRAAGQGPGQPRRLLALRVHGLRLPLQSLFPARELGERAGPEPGPAVGQLPGGPGRDQPGLGQLGQTGRCPCWPWATAARSSSRPVAPAHGHGGPAGPDLRRIRAGSRSRPGAPRACPNPSQPAPLPGPDHPGDPAPAARTPWCWSTPTTPPGPGLQRHGSCGS